MAEDFGITARMVLRCRTDFRKFLSHPWNERAHEVEARTDFGRTQQLAKRLMTPERFAKREPVKIRSGVFGARTQRLFKTAQGGDHLRTRPSGCRWYRARLALFPAADRGGCRATLWGNQVMRVLQKPV